MIHAVRLKRQWLRWVWQVRATLTLKMTLFYGALFVGVTMLTLYGTRKVIETYAENVIRREMNAGSALFDRISVMQQR